MTGRNPEVLKKQRDFEKKKREKKVPFTKEMEEKITILMNPIHKNNTPSFADISQVILEEFNIGKECHPAMCAMLGKNNWERS